MSAILIGFLILWLALTMWVYFDATERGKPSFVWAGAVFFLGFFAVIPLILYLIFRDTGTRTVVPPGGARRQYLYIVSFSGLATLMVGLTLLLITTIMRILDEATISNNDYREAVAAAAAAIILGAAFWASHWFRAVARLERIDDPVEFRASFYLHRAYIYSVFALSWVVIFIAGLWLLGGGLAHLLETEDIESVDWLPALGPIIVAFSVFAFHYLVHFDIPDYRALLNRFETIPPPPVVGATQEPATLVAVAAPASPPAPQAAAFSPPQASGPADRHCTQCGAPARPTHRFCYVCGAALA